jgi:dTDP-4-dehydrorhamnose 3,5-epimerase-like enzyme
MEITSRRFSRKSNNMDKAKMIEFRLNGDERGSLVAIEGEKNLGYRIARIFYMFGMDNSTVRGKHANRESTICLVAIKGMCRIVIDDGFCRETFFLDSPEKALVCYPITWKEMDDFSPDCVLAGICDTLYDASEYINDYTTFIKEVHGE